MTVGLGAIVLIFAVLLSQHDHRRSGSDRTPNEAFAAVLNGGQATCQEGELLPADTAAVEMTIGTYGKPGPPLRVAFTGPHGEALTTGSLPAGWRQGIVRIPIPHWSRPTEGVRVCLTDAGSQPITLAGAVPDPGYTMDVAGAKVEGRLRYDYMRPGRESWLELLPTIVHRSTFARSDLVRHWAWAAALLLMIFSVALAVKTIVREESS
jgi:hypothetical protein